MKNKTVLLLLLLSAASSGASAAPSPARTLKDLSGFPLRAARHMMPAQLFRSLEISPVETWVVARSFVYSQKPAAAKIIHEEGDGAYDKLIVALANTYTTTGNESTETRVAGDTLTFNLVIFKIADGKMAILIPHTDDDRYQGYTQNGDAWIGILRNGKWTRVSHPRKR